MSEASNMNTSGNMYSIKFQRSLYDLKQSKRKWKQAIIAVYIYDLNVIEAPEELIKTAHIWNINLKLLWLQGEDGWCY